MNKIEAAINLDYKSPDDEDVTLEVNMDKLSGQLSVLLDGMYFAHIHVCEDLKVSITFQELIGGQPRPHFEINLRELLEKNK